MILVTRADPAGIPLVVVCYDCVNDPTTIWQRPNDEFWATSLAGWIRVHLRRKAWERPTSWVRTEQVPPEVIEMAKALFQADGARSEGAHSPFAPDPAGSTDLTTVA